MSNANDNVGKLSKVVNIAEARFGAVTGTGNNTSALQLAINAACAVNGTLEMIGGDWYATELDIPDNFEWSCPDPAGCRIIQIAGSNRNFITVAYTVVQNPILRNITIDGNRLNNTSGHGIYLEPHAEPDPAVTYGFGVTMENSYVQNCAEMCMYVGRNRNYGRLYGGELKRGGTGCFYSEDSSDWQSETMAFAFPLSGPALEVVRGANNFFNGGAAFGAIDAPAVRITNLSSSPTIVTGMTINFNQMEGVHIIGAAGLSRHLPIIIADCILADNGLATDNTYAHIKLTDTANTIIACNAFRWLGTGNRCAYLVEFDGASVACEWVGNSYDEIGAVTYGTALSNNNLLLRTRLQEIDLDGNITMGGQIRTKTTTNLDIRLGAALLRASRFMYVASAVNWIEFYQSISGSPVSILAAGSDSDIDVNVQCKGTGTIRTLIASIRDFANDAAAAAAVPPVPIGGFYRNGSVLMIRVT